MVLWFFPFGLTFLVCSEVCLVFQGQVIVLLFACVSGLGSSDSSIHCTSWWGSLVCLGLVPLIAPSIALVGGVHLCVWAWFL